MKLILQIAAGVVLGGVVLWLLSIAVLGAAFRSAPTITAAKSHAPAPAPRATGNVYADVDAQLELDRQAYERRFGKRAPANAARWSITTADGRHFEGEGAPPATLPTR